MGNSDLEIVSNTAGSSKDTIKQGIVAATIIYNTLTSDKPLGTAHCRKDGPSYDAINEHNYTDSIEDGEENQMGKT